MTIIIAKSKTVNEVKVKRTDPHWPDGRVRGEHVTFERYIELFVDGYPEGLKPTVQSGVEAHRQPFFHAHHRGATPLVTDDLTRTDVCYVLLHAARELAVEVNEPIGQVAVVYVNVEAEP